MGIIGELFFVNKSCDLNKDIEPKTAFLQNSGAIGISNVLSNTLRTAQSPEDTILRVILVHRS